MAEATHPLTIPDALADAAQRFDSRPAYIEGSHSVSWRELWRLARETAAGLVSLGLQKGDRVAICAENCIDWIVAYHAVALAGCTSVLVYFELRAGEIAEQVSRPGSRFLIASQSVLDKLPDTIPGVERMIVIGSGDNSSHVAFAELASRATSADLEAVAARPPAPDDLAAIIYTSGTTGGAKGVMLSHRNFMANGRSVTEAIAFTADDRVLLVLPLHHAMPFIASVVLPALVGACFVIENDIRRIRDRLQEHRPTIFFGVPALYELMYRNLLARAESEGRLKMLQAWQKRLGLIKRLTGLNLAPLAFRPIHKALGGRLRFLFCGGAALNPQVVRDFAALGLPLLQGWGMTEASPVIAVQRFSRPRFLLTNYYENHAGSVGEPVPGVEVRLIDVPEKEIRVATSGEGEVITRGENVFVGYWQAEAETQAAKMDGWLRTGDLGRIDKDGNIYLTGRSKYIIVLDSGEKVHPDEVEAKLSQSELVQDVCVLGRRGRDKVQVAALIYPNADAVKGVADDRSLNLTDDAVRRLVTSEVERLGRELAAYKRVSRIELTDTPLPKTPLQKIARGRIKDEYSFDLAAWLASSVPPTPSHQAD